MKKNRRFIILMFLTLLFASLARVVCQKFCLTNNLYQAILTDCFHHYQVGVLILIVSLMFWNRLKNKWFIPVAIGLIVDESMYLLHWTRYREFANFHQYRLEGIIYSWVVFLTVVALTVTADVKIVVKTVIAYGLAIWILEWGSLLT